MLLFTKDKISEIPVYQVRWQEAIIRVLLLGTVVFFPMKMLFLQYSLPPANAGKKRFSLPQNHGSPNEKCHFPNEQIHISLGKC
jgi:hypothetical protein